MSAACCPWGTAMETSQPHLLLNIFIVLIIYLLVVSSIEKQCIHRVLKQPFQNHSDCNKWIFLDKCLPLAPITERNAHGLEGTYSRINYILINFPL